MKAKLKAYKFSPDMLDQSAGNFRTSLESRYGSSSKLKTLTKADIDQLVKHHYKEDKGKEKLESGDSKEDQGET